jgi:hypothetical protein
MNKCPYLSGKKTEECPWIKPACMLEALKKDKVIPPQTLSILFGTLGSTSRTTQRIWDEKANER